MGSQTSRSIQANIVLLALLVQLIFFVAPTRAVGEEQVRQRVTVGQPNVWSLEQAHYLLARIRERNLGITNPALAPTDLDPNAINGTRLDALRTYFELGVSFDQGLGLNNRIGRQNLEFNQTRHQELLTRRAALFDERNRMLEEKGTLLSDLTALQATTGNDDAIKQKNSEIDALNKKLDANNGQLENLKTESDLLGSASSTITSPTPPTGAGALGSIGDRIGKTITDAFAHDADKNPRLAASIKLDNYVQMQYELLAKQLTLLRDEVGPDERLIFMELPTSIYVPPKADKDLIAQSLWHIKSFYRNNDYLASNKAVESMKQGLADKFNSDSAGRTDAERYRLLVDYDMAARGLNEEQSDIRRRFYDDKAETLKRGEQFFASIDADTKLCDDAGAAGLKGRIVDLIPRQSSLNVSDINEHINEHSFKAIFSFLIGIGASGTYQRRREQFEQFQQQEVYAAGFGKGSNVFGWTFSPMPGTQRLAPGVRTTYAVMIVPRRATHLVLEAGTRTLTTQAENTSYPWPTTKDNKDKCVSDTSTFDITIPGGANEDNFFVTRIDYPTVPVNQRSVVVLRGNFSTQTGVLINGTALTRVVGVAGPWLGSEREANTSTAMDLGEPDKNIKGYYEIINSNQIILVFLMNKDFKGTPDITLVSPERARSLNDLRLNVNGEAGQHLPAYVIGKKDEEAKPPLAITEVQMTVTRPAAKPPLTSVPAKVNLSVAGVKKDEDPKIYFGAVPVASVSRLAAGLYNVAVDLPVNDESISFTVVQGDDSSTKQLDNPIFAKVSVVRINYNRGDEEDADDDEVTIELAGTRIANLDATVVGATREWRGQTASQGAVVLRQLSRPEISVTLTDRLTNQTFPPIFVRRLPAKPKKAKRDSITITQNESPK